MNPVQTTTPLSASSSRERFVFYVDRVKVRLILPDTGHSAETTKTSVNVISADRCR